MTAAIRFAKNDDLFWDTLKRNVKDYFEQNGISPYANAAWWIRASLMGALFIVPYFILLFRADIPWLGFFCCVLMGFGMAGIGMAVSHQAAHQTISKRKWVNRLMSMSFNLLGVSDYLWHIKHDVYHHAYTNIYALDEALREGEAFRFTEDSPRKWYHKYQHIHGVVVYALFTVFWAFALDFEKLARYNAFGSREKRRHPAGELVLFWLTKVYYVVVCFVIPYLAGYGWLQIAAGFLTVHIIASSIITHVLQVEHINTETDLQLAGADGLVPKTWAKNQLEGTADFRCGNRLLEWYVAGTNYQIEHHLFPAVNVAHFPAVSKIVEKTAEEFGLRYMVFPSFSAAIFSHYGMLRRLGQTA